MRSQIRLKISPRGGGGGGVATPSTLPLDPPLTLPEISELENGNIKSFRHEL